MSEPTPTAASCLNLIASTGTTLAMSTAAPAGPALNDLNGLTYTTVGMIESIGEFGDENEVGSFRPLGEDVVCQYMAGKQPTTITLSMARATNDTGQNAFIDHQGNTQVRGFRITTSQNNHSYFFAGFVASSKVNIGSGSDVVKINGSVAITGNVYEVTS